MPLLALSHVSVHFGISVVLDDVTLAIEKGDRIGVVGSNGAGKSTLLRALAGRLEPTAGNVVAQRGATMGLQEQELAFEPGATVLGEMRKVLARDFEREGRMRALEAALAGGPAPEEQRRQLAEYDRLQREKEAEGGGDADRRIASMLTSLGLPEAVWERELSGFSGGERNILGLARVLLARPDVMLLDEPSNHLDMDGVDWFVEFLRSTDAAVVMVSHNRHLLDVATKVIWEVGSSRVVSWTGNYSSFKQQKEEARALQERRYRNQQRTIERIEFQARRLMDMANAYDDPAQARRAKSMRKRLERMEKVQRPDSGPARFQARLGGGGRHGRIALQIRGFDCAFDDRVLFEKAELEIEYGERVCLVGPNGSGKTTLFRRILAEGAWENPVLRLGKSVRADEYRQLHDLFDPRETLQGWAMRATGLERAASAKLLHRFLFTFDDLERAIGTLSGGEKSRLQLARLSHEKVNLLMLDEPTNHLDLQACEQLEESLQEYDGTLFVISHDRYFLDKLVTRVVEVRDRGLLSHPGGFEEWWQARREGPRRKSALSTHGMEEEGADKGRARREREERKALQRESNKLKTELERLEREIHDLEDRKCELGPLLEEAWKGGGDPKEAMDLAAELKRVDEALAALYPRWDEAAGALDT